MEKFCCDSFRFRYEGVSELGLNFRIIKLSQDFIDRGYLGENRYRYLITEGYKVFDQDMKMLVMEFCPYCGTKLASLYNSDQYINEQNHPF
ncbi:hypothetical protein [Chitinophaga sancti]|uniref:Uncharacterized protein n=1 Tax=Chitinophaga sancti TaxID=1004 RepID=A0A1K1SD58_9BACT|nr:hypothetical protein [Chitinophaga sancti]WQD63579.1 hypothetical protein U0033_04165 [Chitinophaga sancti]WQG90795.1 hypothetical protein SR876_04750 [Chitinophaga sancti]SFW81837.1 hypothetical protein SAMN05661012_05150 [Chitinophaga sancti]